MLLGRKGRNKAQFPQTGLTAVVLLGNTMKSWEILVYLKKTANRHTHECFLSQPFSSRHTQESSSFKTQQNILAK